MNTVLLLIAVCGIIAAMWQSYQLHKEVMAYTDNLDRRITQLAQRVCWLELYEDNRLVAEAKRKKNNDNNPTA